MGTQNSCLLSIVIPIYNVEKYLDACLNSILKQDYYPNEIEVICVNDGSTDNSASVVDKYSAVYPNVRLINKQNGGVSSARNVGLDAAQGDYIWFIDGDDFIADGSLKCLLGLIKENLSDGITFDITHVDEEENKILAVNFSITSKTLTVKDEIFNIVTKDEKGKNILSACGTIFKKNILSANNLKFRSDMILYEDVEFLENWKILASTVTYVPITVYAYRTRGSSATRVDKTAEYQKKRVTNLLLLATDYEELYKRYRYKYLKIQAVRAKNEIYEVLTTIPDREFVKSSFNKAIKIVRSRRYYSSGKTGFKRRIVNTLRVILPVRWWFCIFYNLHNK